MNTDAKPFNIPTVPESVATQYRAGRINLHEAAKIFWCCGWANFIDEDFARKLIEEWAAQQ